MNPAFAQAILKMISVLVSFGGALTLLHGFVVGLGASKMLEATSANSARVYSSIGKTMDIDIAKMSADLLAHVHIANLCIVVFGLILFVWSPGLSKLICRAK